MSNSRQWDSLEWGSLDFPYNLVERELSEEPRLVAGQNCYINYGGKMVKRPGTIQVDSGINTTLAKRLDRLWLYETLDSPAKIYIVASAYDSTSATWGLYYIRLDATGSPAWTSAGSLRGVNVSYRPHEAVVSRGLLYVKSFPTSNLLQYSQDFPQSPWSPSGVTVTSNSIAAPDGTVTADTLTPGSGAAYINQNSTTTIINGAAYTFSVWLKSTSGVVSLPLFILQGGTPLVGGPVSVTTTWQRFSTTVATTSTSALQVQIGDGANWTPATAVYAWGAQLEFGGTAGTYGVTTTSAATERLGTVIFDGTAGAPSLRFWGLIGPTVPAHFSGAVPRINESSTPGITSTASSFHVTAQNTPNLLEYSEDFSNAAWTKTSVTVTSNSTTAPDGTNNGTLLTPTSGVDSYMYETPTTIPGSTYTFSVYLKSATGANVSMSLTAQDASGSTAAACTVTTSWQRFSVTRTTSQVAVQFVFGAGGTWLTGENIYAWGAQAEIASTATTYTRTLGPYGFPATPFNVQIDSELITVTAFNTGTGVATVLRAAQGTVAAAHADKSLVIYRDWATSAHPGAVNVGWTYTYAYKTITGHISNRAPVETNPDWNPSNTGAFFNLIPKINVQGTSDTTNVPTIVLYRSTDGGGTYMKLSEITNLGAFPISYSDTTLTSTSGSQDPIPDSALNSQELSASLTTNSPPTTVVAPLVVGTDTPAASTRIVSYSGRLWYAIGNTLFFSANEEINVGIPEESWPTGLYGNFYKFQHPVTNLIDTTDALYVITTQTTYQITGSNKETFNPKPLLNDIGGAQGHPRAIARYGDAIVWLTNDLRLGILQDSNFRTISEPLGSDITTLINTKAAEIDIKYFADLEKEWLVVTALCTTATDNRTWVYDVKKSIALKKDFWNAPWSIRASAIVSGRLRETQQQRRLGFFTWTGSTGFLTRLAVTPSENTGTDVLPGPTTSAITYQVRTNLFQVPPGNHINALRRPGILPVIQHFVLERTLFAGDSDPTTTYYLNDLWTTPIPVTPPVGPSRDDEPKGYKTMVYPINTKGRRVGLEINTNDTNLFEIQNIILTWNSDGGASI